MKNLFLPLAFIFAVVFTSCEKATDILNSSMTASVDGVSFVANGVNGSVVSNRLTLTGTTLNASKTMNIILPDTVSVGTHQLSGLSGTYSAQYLEGSNPYNVVSGSVDVTEHNTTSKKIKGTFNFSAVNTSLTTIGVSNGNFTVYY